MPATDQELADAIARAALLRGSFTLRSGRKSSYYLDKYRFTTRPELLRRLTPLLAEAARSFGGFGAGAHDRLAGAELGGIPLVTAVGLETGVPFVFLRNKKKDYGTAQQLEGAMEPGDRVVFLEDVVTSGGQAVESVAALRKAGAEVLGVVAVVDRQEGGAAAITAAGVGFKAIFTKTDLGVDE